MIPAALLDDCDATLSSEVPAPLHVEIQAIPHQAYGWLACYHFYLGASDDHMSYVMGPVDSMTAQQADERARAEDSPFLAKARQAFLQSVHLETKQ